MLAFEAVTEHVKVDAIEENGVGPAVLAQAIPVTPVMDHVPVPVGTAPPVGPVTVAVKVNVEPKATVACRLGNVDTKWRGRSSRVVVRITWVGYCSGVCA